MRYTRMPIEAESPEEMGYSTIRCNLAESSVRDITLQELGVQMNDLLLCYGPHRGDLSLREAIVADQPGLSAGQVLVTPGAAGALFLIATTLLDKDSHMIVVRPNYATNLETPRAIGCQMTVIDLSFENGYGLEVDSIKAAITPYTKLISMTSPHNPTGVRVDEQVIRELAGLAESSGCYLLVDETYRDLSLDGLQPQYSARINPSVISVASLSKAYGVPGIRTGWVICRDSGLMEQLLAAKEQVFICGSVLDEAVAAHVLQNRECTRALYGPMVQHNWAYLQGWMKGQNLLEWVRPDAGVVCFPRFRENIQLDTDKFYKVLWDKYGTMVGPGHWFEQSPRHMRIGFGYPLEEEFKQGLENILLAAEESLH